MANWMKRTFLSWWVVFGMIAWLYVFMQLGFGAQLHGKMWPVVTPLQVTKVEPVDINGVPGSRIRGYANIERDSCDYIDVTWRLNGDKRSVNVTAFFADAPVVRENGQQEWEALMVGIPPERLADTTGTAIHRCGTFPVNTPFFVPEESITPDDIGATAICESGAYSTSDGPGTCSGHGGVKEWLI